MITTRLSRCCGGTPYAQFLDRTAEILRLTGHQIRLAAFGLTLNASSGGIKGTPTGPA